MPRSARIVIPDIPYHITQRGNNRQNVFFSSNDRVNYLNWLQQYSSRYKLDILGYCLMTNHVHLIATPRNSDSMARTVNVLNMRHAQKINKIHRRDGHLWKSRFFSVALDDAHLWLCLRYIEQNPVYAGMVKKAEDYKWSSAVAHCGLRDDPTLTPDSGFDLKLDSWSKILGQSIPKEEVNLIKNRTHSGTPLGHRKFLLEMGILTGMNFFEKKKGRPRKAN